MKSYDLPSLASATVAALEAELYAYVMTTDDCPQNQAYIERALEEARDRVVNPTYRDQIQ